MEEQKFSAPLPAYTDLFSSPSSVTALQRTIALHLLRTGQFNVAETFLAVSLLFLAVGPALTSSQESGVEIPEQVRDRFFELHDILKGLRNQDISLALAYASFCHRRITSNALPAGPSSAESFSSPAAPHWSFTCTAHSTSVSCSPHILQTPFRLLPTPTNIFDPFIRNTKQSSNG